MRFLPNRTAIASVRSGASELRLDRFHLQLFRIGRNQVFDQFECPGAKRISFRRRGGDAALQEQRLCRFDESCNVFGRSLLINHGIQQKGCHVIQEIQQLLPRRAIGRFCALFLGLTCCLLFFILNHLSELAVYRPLRRMACEQP